MGEYSKRVGDVGESVVEDFLKIIGWNNPMRNDDIQSLDKTFRLRTNGMDGYYHYKSPMISNTLEHVLYSCKYGTEPYPKTKLGELFKERYYELAKLIESFKKSNLKFEISQQHGNIDTHFNRGILFWLNNSGDDDNDIISNLQSIELNSEVIHDGIILVDNKRIEFIYDVICYTQWKFQGYDIDFIYFNNGLNEDNQNERSGKIMPIQYINSSIIPLIARREKETIVILHTIEKFEYDDLTKYIGIAKNIGCNVQGSTHICFPDYKETVHAPRVNAFKNAFGDQIFTSNLTIANFNNSILR